jgi:hypothetical protein
VRIWNPVCSHTHSILKNETTGNRIRTLGGEEMKADLASMALLLLLSPIARLEAAEPSPNDVFRDAAKIVAPDGIDIGQMVQIGGINQWISIRGRHRDNPILLVLHGGPGFTTIPSSYYFLRDWEEYYTVAQWDQRGAHHEVLSGGCVPLEVLEARVNAWILKSGDKEC